MSVPKLHYYDMGGRAFAARLAFVVGGVEFEDIRYKDGAAIDAAMEKNPKLFPCQTVPTLEVGDVVISQSRAIAFYAARVAKLMPEDALKLAEIDEVVATIDDLVDPLMGTMGKENLAEARAEWVEKTAKPMLARIAAIYARASPEGPFLHGEKPSAADFMLAGIIAYVGSGTLDHVPQDLVMANYPRLAAAFGALMANPAVAAFAAKHPTF
eukprot:CAMPEP_0174853588 /NCGR_PEP_ID=MMETSP1114-20130205/29041_1 /TAXON_ID=312471 /ORGANISM="Neobodo designis, Strain CCAP 1951/1" /LENGTH=211 /DNA_ID=CAMNT_0016088243 /DNA_START=42 /DNA_END=677 /DNA_ORIENTATION=+